MGRTVSRIAFGYIALLLVAVAALPKYDNLIVGGGVCLLFISFGLIFLFQPSRSILAFRELRRLPRVKEPISRQEIFWQQLLGIIFIVICANVLWQNVIPKL